MSTFNHRLRQTGNPVRSAMQSESSRITQFASISSRLQQSWHQGPRPRSTTSSASTSLGLASIKHPHHASIKRSITSLRDHLHHLHRTRPATRHANASIVLFPSIHTSWRGGCGYKAGQNRHDTLRSRGRRGRGWVKWQRGLITPFCIDSRLCSNQGSSSLKISSDILLDQILAVFGSRECMWELISSDIYLARVFVLMDGNSFAWSAIHSSISIFIRIRSSTCYGARYHTSHSVLYLPDVHRSSGPSGEILRILDTEKNT